MIHVINRDAKFRRAVGIDDWLCFLLWDDGSVTAMNTELFPEWAGFGAGNRRPRINAVIDECERRARGGHRGYECGHFREVFPSGTTGLRRRVCEVRKAVRA